MYQVHAEVATVVAKKVAITDTKAKSFVLLNFFIRRYLISQIYNSILI